MLPPQIAIVFRLIIHDLEAYVLIKEQISFLLHQEGTWNFFFFFLMESPTCSFKTQDKPFSAVSPGYRIPWLGHHGPPADLNKWFF